MKPLIYSRKKLKFAITFVLPAVFTLITLILLNSSAQPIEKSQQQIGNLIIWENQKNGTTDWQLTNPAIKREIEGYASLTSVNRGDEIKFFVNTKEPSYRINFFRMGWYGGDGGREIIEEINRIAVKQPLPIVNQETGLIECNWHDPYTLKIPDKSTDPTEWLSGVYLAKLTASESQKQSYIIFVVRDDSRPSDILFQSSVTTYQAYNNWGGNSLYRWNSLEKQAFKVSFNRPYAVGPNHLAAYGVGAGEFLTNLQPKKKTSNAGWEYNMVRWLESSGYDVTYSTNIDTHNNSIELHSGKPLLWLHKAFLSVGHDEYWSWQMRQNIQAARDKGVSLGFFGANTSYWQIRLEPSLITREINRTIVAYKENVALDPLTRDSNRANDYLATTLWRNQPVDRPEDELIGVMYETYRVNGDIVISPTAPDWLLAGTQLDTVKNKLSVAPNDKKPLKELRLVGLLGYEVDRMFRNAPANTIRIAHSPYKYDGGTRYSNVTIYTAKSGATVFATGSMQWSWGLDDYNAPLLRPSVVSADAQAITHNVLNRMIAR
jgi:hypothetical protein